MGRDDTLALVIQYAVLAAAKGRPTVTSSLLFRYML